MSDQTDAILTAQAIKRKGACRRTFDERVMLHLYEAYLSASATRESIIDECIEACRKEYLVEPVKDTSDEEYDNAIKHCIDALHALKRAGRG